MHSRRDCITACKVESRYMSCVVAKHVQVLAASAVEKVEMRKLERAFDLKCRGWLEIRICFRRHDRASIVDRKRGSVAPADRLGTGAFLQRLQSFTAKGHALAVIPTKGDVLCGGASHSVFDCHEGDHAGDQFHGDVGLRHCGGGMRVFSGMREGRKSAEGADQKRASDVHDKRSLFRSHV